MPTATLSRVKAPLHQRAASRQGIHFPTLEELTLYREQGIHQVVEIPDVFANFFEYKSTLTLAVQEQLNVQLLESASELLSACSRLPTVQTNGPSCKHGPASLLTSKKEGPRQGQQFYTCCSRQDKCRFFLWADEYQASVAPANSNRKSNSNPESVRLERAHEPLLRSAGLFVQLRVSLVKSEFRPFKRGAESTGKIDLSLELSWKGSAGFAKDDLWVVAREGTFFPTSPKDISMLKSVFHGPSSGSLRVKCLDKPNGSFPKSSVVCALKGPNASSEMAILDNLEKFNPRAEIIPALLGQHADSPNFQVEHSAESIAALLDELVDQHRLNEDQRSVLQRCVRWVRLDAGESNAGSRVVLVHGTFGSGKSFLLCVLIVFLSKLLENTPHRILVSAVTNTAVDRVLLGLLELGFVSLLRVGSLPKIAKKILPYTLHRTERSKKKGEESDIADAIKDLKEMLNEPSLSDEERALVEQELRAARDGQMQRRKDLLRKVRVVGATCAAAAFPVLDGQSFSIVFLDECSQMIEPLALLPLRFDAKALICVGDPQQLPPTLAADHKNQAQLIESGIGKTMFVRLASKYPPIMLRTQYRVIRENRRFLSFSCFSSF